MRRTIYIGGAAATFTCLRCCCRSPTSRRSSPARTPTRSRPPGDAFGPVGCKIVLGRRAHLVPVLRHEPAGRRQPADLLLRPRRDDRRAQRSEEVRPRPRHVPPFALMLAGVIPRSSSIGSIVSTDALAKICPSRRSASTSASRWSSSPRSAPRLKGWTPSRRVQLGTLGHGGQRRGARLRRRRHGQHRLAAHPGRALVRQLHRAPRPPWSSAPAWSTCSCTGHHDRSDATHGDAVSSGAAQPRVHTGLVDSAS